MRATLLGPARDLNRLRAKAPDGDLLPVRGRPGLALRLDDGRLAGLPLDSWADQVRLAFDLLTAVPEEEMDKIRLDF